MPLVHLFVNTDGSLFQIKPPTEPVGKMDTYVVFGISLSPRELKYLSQHLGEFTMDFPLNWPRHNLTHQLLSPNLCLPLNYEFKHLSDKYIIELLYDYNPYVDGNATCSHFTKELYYDKLSIEEERKYWENFYIHYHNEPMIDYVRWAVAYGSHGDIILAWSTLNEQLRQSLVTSHLIKDDFHKRIINNYYKSGKMLEERIKQQ